MLFSTYNIHYGVGTDGKYDVLRAADAVGQADIICLQKTVRGWPQNGYAGRRLNRNFRFHGPMEADASTVSADGWITNRRRSFGMSRPPLRSPRGRCGSIARI
jgi:endonuclease/exonuclease/phosphatase family metal-dependent hydrolase